MKLKGIKLGGIYIPCQTETKIELPVITMGDLKIGQSFTSNTNDWFRLMDEREELRSKGFDYIFRVGKGIITVRRIA